MAAVAGDDAVVVEDAAEDVEDEDVEGDAAENDAAEDVVVAEDKDDAAEVVVEQERHGEVRFVDERLRSAIAGDAVAVHWEEEAERTTVRSVGGK